MKKLLVTIVTAFMTMAGYAQTTFNVRVGGGFFQTIENDYLGASIALETNIPLGARTNKFVFSPSMLIASDFSELLNMNVPLHLGYKVPIGNGSLFIPKIGPMVGFKVGDSNDTMAFGPSTELAFEIKHFVVAVNGYMDVWDTAKFGAFATIGYKF